MKNMNFNHFIGIDGIEDKHVLEIMILWEGGHKLQAIIYWRNHSYYSFPSHLLTDEAKIKFLDEHYKKHFA